MPQGTITLPSGDKLITQTETLPSGALVHREEIVLSGTISDQLITPVTSAPAVGVWGLPTYPVTQPIDAAVHAMNAVLGNAVLLAGQVNDTATTTVTEGKVGAARITPQRALHVNLRSTSGSEITNANPLPVSIPGTVQINFVPAASQNVNLLNVGFAGTPLRVDPTGTTTQPVSIAGTVAVSFTPASTQNVSLLNVGFAGTPIRTDPTGTTTQPVSAAGTIATNVTSLPPITFAAAQPISTIAGTVQVAFTPAAIQNVNLMNVGFAGTPLRMDPTGTTTQPVSIAGTIAANVTSIPAITFAAPQPISTVAGTVAVNMIASVTHGVNLLNMGVPGTPLRIDPIGTTTQPVSIAGTVAASITSLPPITFASPQPISTVAGTIVANINTMPAMTIAGTLSLPDYARYSEQLTQSSRLLTLDTDVQATTAAMLGTPAVKFASAQPISTIAGTVQVSILPSTIHGVNLLNVGFAGTPLRIDPVGTTTQPVSIAGTVVTNVNSLPAITFASAQPVTVSGTIGLPDYARYSEQQTQSVRLLNVDTDVQAVTAAVLGTPAMKFAAAQPISTIAGTVRVDPTGTTTQPVSIAGTIVSNINSMPTMTFASPQPISTVAGTVAVSVVLPATQPVSIAGTIAANINSLPAITFASAQPISTVAGTIAANVVSSVTQSIASVAGTVVVSPAPLSFRTARVEFGGSGMNTIAGSIFGRRLKIYAMNLAADRRGTVSMVWMDGNSGLSGTQTFVDREGFTMAVDPPAFLIAPSPGTSAVIHIPTGNTASLKGWVGLWDNDTV